jgi:hypothetical protein
MLRHFTNGYSLQATSNSQRQFTSTTTIMEQAPQAPPLPPPQMSFPNHAQDQYQQPPIQALHQQAPIQQPNNFANQQPFQGQGQMNEAPLLAYQPPMQQETYQHQPLPMQHNSFQPQQAQYHPDQNAQQQPQPVEVQPMPQYAPVPPLAQGQQLATPGGVEASDLVKQKPLWKDKRIWVGGQSVVGRKGIDGKWMEVKSCSVM